MKKAIKIFSLVLAVLMLAMCMTGCGKSGKSLKALKKSGELVIATSPDFPPFEELQSDGSVTGIEIDLLNLICEKLGVKLVIKQLALRSTSPSIVPGTLLLQ